MSYKNNIILIFLLFIEIYAKTEKTSEEIIKFKEWNVDDVFYLISQESNNNFGIYDPEEIITISDKQKINTQLKKIKNRFNVNLYIVIVNRFENRSKQISNMTDVLINMLYENKIVENDIPIILTMISAKDRVMTMRIKGNINKIITKEDTFTLLTQANNYFSYEEFGNGILDYSHNVLFYLEHTTVFGRNIRLIIGLVLILGIFISCALIAKLAEKIQQRRNTRLTMSDEEKVIKIKEFLKKCKANRKILDDNCIICLEPFDNCVSLNNSIINKSKINKESNNISKNKSVSENNADESNINNKSDIKVNVEDKKRNKTENNKSKSVSENIIDEDNFYNNNKSDIKLNVEDNKSNKSDNMITTLQCGHRYHLKCITEWMLKEQTTCPMCREKINVDIPEPGAEVDDFQNELLNIQIDLHPALAFLAFEVINQQISFGAAAVPAIGGGLLYGLGGFALV